MSFRIWSRSSSAQGHDVTLFASGDSRTSATLVPVVPTALRLARCRDPVAPHVLMIERVVRQSATFDVVHFHIDTCTSLSAGAVCGPHVTTLHGRLDLPELAPLYAEFRRYSAASPSPTRSATPLPRRQLGRHGAARTAARSAALQSSTEADYLAFLGRISPEKRVDRAIEIARRCGQRLQIAAKVDAADVAYFDNEIRRCSTTRWSSYIGEIGEHDKARFSRARQGAAVSDRLARTLRPGHDRIARVRHSGDRLSPRFGCRSHR